MSSTESPAATRASAATAQPKDQTTNGAGNGRTPSAGADLSPAYLMPLMEGAPTQELATYRSLYMLEVLDGETPDTQPLTEPIDPFDPELGELAQTPAIGVVTVHEQGWTQQGLALGNLLHSICLAPGEVTQVAVVDWQRQVTGTSLEQGEQDEAVTSRIDQTRAVNEVQRAVAGESQSGGSMSAATAATAQAGTSFGALFGAASMSGSVTASAALTAQFSVGARNLAASSTNALSQRTLETSQALRSRRAAVVREISEREAETVSSRVVANYNRRHALNIEYFEVLQLYRLETRLADWDRCVFVPLKPIEFADADVLKRHQAALTQILTARGQTELAAEVDTEARGRRLADLDRRIEDVEKAIAQDRAAIDDHLARIRWFGTAVGLAALSALSGTPDLKQAAEKAEKDYHALAGDREHQGWLPPLEAGTAGTLQTAMGKRSAAAEDLRRRVEEARRDLETLRDRRAALAVPAVARLMDDQLALSQEIWLRMDPALVSRMLQRFTVGGQPLATLVEPYPVGVFGNHLAFRWRFGDDEKARGEFARRYLHSDAKPAEPTIATTAVPTSGVFAEAVLGRGEAAETIDDTRLWKWSDNTIPLVPTALKPRETATAAKGGGGAAASLDLKGGDFVDALAKLRSTDPENAAHTKDLLDALRSGGMFRDMGGLQQGASLAEKVAGLSAAGAQQAGKTAADIQVKILDTFVKLLDSDVGRAAVAEFMLPGAGAAVLGTGGDAKAKKTPAKT